MMFIVGEQLFKKTLVTVVLLNIVFTMPVQLQAKEFLRNNTAYGNEDPRTGQPYYGDLQHQTGATNYGVRQKINYRKALHVANEIKNGQLPLRLPNHIASFQATLKDATLALQKCDQAMFTRIATRLKNIRKATHKEYIEEYTRFHTMNLLFIEHETAIRSATPTNAGRKVAVSALVGKTSTAFARSLGHMAEVARQGGGAVARCHPVVQLITLIPTVISGYSEITKLATVMTHTAPALELLELKLYYEFGVLPEYKAKIIVMDEAIAKVEQQFQTAQCRQAVCEESRGTYRDVPVETNDIETVPNSVPPNPENNARRNQFREGRAIPGKSLPTQIR